MDRFWDKVDKSDGCWEWTASVTSAGYGQFYFNGKLDKAHRVALILEGVDIPSGMKVCHTCDNRTCVNPDHLFVGTQAENMTDCVQKGRIANGSKQGCSKLTEEDVPRIRDMLRCGAMQKDIADWFNVGVTTISNIKLGKSWAHVRIGHG